MKSKKQARTKI